MDSARQKISNALQMIGEVGNSQRVTNLDIAKRAGVSEATLYRNRDLVDVWRTEVSQTQPSEAELELRALKKRYERLLTTNSQLEKQLATAASVINELTLIIDDFQGRGSVQSLQAYRP